jgi:pyruvate formate lyase activating enzyme
MAHEKEVLFQERLAGGRFRCLTCPHACRLAEGAFGRCGVRIVREGRLVSLTAERVVAVHADPIEKKPLYHALPGTRSLSFGAPGCNLTCTFCQNCSISQVRGGPLPGERVDPVRLARVAREQGCPSLCATYTEPTIFFELARAAGRAAREAGLRNFWVSNGYMSAPVRRDLAAWVDGINIDLKAFRDDFYRTLCGGRLAPVRESIADLAERGVWVEVTTLVIPGRNDGEEELGEMARFLASISAEMPWHLSAFHPDHRMLDVPPTPAATLLRAREIGREAGLHHVYIGNLRLPGGADTRCPGCGRLLIRREGFGVAETDLDGGGACPGCGRRLAGIF